MFCNLQGKVTERTRGQKTGISNVHEVLITKNFLSFYKLYIISTDYQHGRRAIRGGEVGWSIRKRRNHG